MDFPDRFVIAPERSALRVEFKPRLPGLGAEVTGFRGTFQGSVTDEGIPDMGAPFDGRFTVDVGELELGNRLFTYAARVWLGRDAGVAATGTLESISDRGGGAFEATVALTMKGTTHRVDASGAISKVGEALSLVGITKVHPRDVGVPLPRRGTPMVHCHWDLHLVRDTE